MKVIGDHLSGAFFALIFAALVMSSLGLAIAAGAVAALNLLLAFAGALRR